MVKLILTEEEITDIVEMVLEELKHRDVLTSKMMISEMFNRHIVCEGLIKTYSVKDTINFLLNKGIKKYYIYPLKIVKGDNKMLYSINLKFRKGFNNIPNEVIVNLIHILDTCGWFFSIGYCNGKYFKELNNKFIENNTEYNNIDLIFEPKFDVNVSKDELPDKLYHVTPNKNIDKIYKNGLTPRNNNKVTNHPERVYLFGENNINNWKNIALNLKGENINEKYSLLEIEVNKVNKNIVFMYDPNCEFEAYYVLEPITPYSIKVIDSEK